MIALIIPILAGLLAVVFGLLVYAEYDTRRQLTYVLRRWKETTNDLNEANNLIRRLLDERGGR